MDTLNLTDIEEVTLAIEAEDAAGNPAVEPAVPTWSVSDSSVLSLEAAADGMSCLVVTTGKLGSAQVSVTDGVIIGSLNIAVGGSAAVAFRVTAGAPVSRLPTPSTTTAAPEAPVDATEPVQPSLEGA